MKLKTIMILMLVLVTLFAGCTKKNNTATVTPSPSASEVPAATSTPKTGTNETTDVVTTASIVDSQEAFLKAVGPNAFWLAAIIKDLTIDKEIVVEGEYTKADKADPSKQVPAGRKIALYAQDEDRNKTASYTLTAPKMTVKSKDTKIQGGTFVGDVYVEATGFNLVDATVDGNVYFKSQDLKDTFKLDEKSAVTGKTEVK